MGIEAVIGSLIASFGDAGAAAGGALGLTARPTPGPQQPGLAR